MELYDGLNTKKEFTKDEDSNLNLQLKDITKVILFTQKGENIVEVERVDFNNFNIKDYLVKVEMKTLPLMYAEIESVINENNNISFKLKSEGFVSYEGNKKLDGLVVKYGVLDNNEIVPNYLKKENLTHEIKKDFHNDIILNEEYVKSESELYIPDLERLKSMPEYDDSKSLTYSNLYKLIPFYDAKYLILDGNKVDFNHKLNTKKIVSIFPLDASDIRVVGLDRTSVKNINKLRVGYEDGISEIYNIEFLDIKNDIASYTIPQFGIHYNFNKYIINKESDLIKELINKTSGYTFDNDLAPSVKGADHSSVINTYKANFNNVVKKEVADVLISLFANNPQYGVNSTNKVAQKMVRDELYKDDYFKDFLYVYNYVDRWYDFEIGGINLRDVVLFDNSIMNVNEKPINLVKEFCEWTSTDSRLGNKTQVIYANRIAKFTGINNVSSFVEHFISKYANYSDVNNWIIDNFKGGVIVEAKPNNPDIESRLWKKLKNNTVHKDQQLVLPTLSYKGGKHLYIASFTTAIVYGNLEIYTRYKGTDESRQSMKKEIENYTNKLSAVYDNLAKITSNKAESINKSKFLLVDSCFDTKNHNQDVFQHYYIPLQTLWRSNNAAVSVIFGTPEHDYIYFNTSYFIDSIETISHEMGHVTDMWIFMENKGKRPGRNGEDYSNGFANQLNLQYNMNLMQDYSRDGEAMSNLSPDRINSPDKFQSFYKEVFDTLYTLDYLQGKAFLQLTPEQQCRVAAQHRYGIMNAHQTANSVNSTWKLLGKEELINMNLKTLEDLWDNQLTIRPGHRYDIKSQNEVGSNNFGAYNIDKVSYANWYVPYVEGGNPNAQIFRRNGFELAGILGYSNGLADYLSGATQTGDLEFYRTKLNNPNFTFKQYRMDKNAEIESKIKRAKDQGIGYFDEEILIEYFKNALIEAANKNDINSGMSIPGFRTLEAIRISRETVYRYLQRITDDFRSPIYNDEVKPTMISTGEEFIRLISDNPNGYYSLANDIQLSDVEGQSSIINKTFMGRLDGRGHTISGITQTLFNRISNSYITGLSLKTAPTDSHKPELLAKQKFSVIETK